MIESSCQQKHKGEKGTRKFSTAWHKPLQAKKYLFWIRSWCVTPTTQTRSGPSKMILRTSLGNAMTVSWSTIYLVATPTHVWVHSSSSPAKRVFRVAGQPKREKLTCWNRHFCRAWIHASLGGWKLFAVWRWAENRKWGAGRSLLGRRCRQLHWRVVPGTDPHRLRISHRCVPIDSVQNFKRFRQIISLFSQIHEKGQMLQKV